MIVFLFLFTHPLQIKRISDSVLPRVAAFLPAIESAIQRLAAPEPFLAASEPTAATEPSSDALEPTAPHHLEENWDDVLNNIPEQLTPTRSSPLKTPVAPWAPVVTRVPFFDENGLVPLQQEEAPVVITHTFTVSGGSSNTRRNLLRQFATCAPPTAAGASRKRKRAQDGDNDTPPRKSLRTRKLPQKLEDCLIRSDDLPSDEEDE